MAINKKVITVRPVINKRNGQCVISLPRKKMPQEMVKDIFNIKQMRIALEGWE